MEFVQKRNSQYQVNIYTERLETIPIGTLRPWGRFTASLKTRASPADPSHPGWTYVNRISRSQAANVFVVICPFLFLNRGLRALGTKMLICVPSRAPRHPYKKINVYNTHSKWSVDCDECILTNVNWWNNTLKCFHLQSTQSSRTGSGFTMNNVCIFMIAWRTSFT